MEVTSGTQQATAYYYAAPQSRMALYPNPANTYVDVANEDAVATTTQAAAASQFPAVAAASVGAPVPMHVTVHNRQAKLVFTAADVTVPTLRLNVQDWPDGLYQVTVRRGQTTTRRQLSIQH